MIIGVLSQKGGVGKSTISINIAATLSKQGKRVVLVDADPQGSSMSWSAAREAELLFPVIGMAKPTLHKDPARDREGLRPRHHRRRASRERSRPSRHHCERHRGDTVQPSPYDVWAAAETVQLVREAQQFKPKLKAVFVVNRKIANTAIGRDVAERLRNSTTYWF